MVQQTLTPDRFSKLLFLTLVLHFRPIIYLWIKKKKTNLQAKIKITKAISLGH